MMSATLPVENQDFDVEKIRQDFPILHQEIHGKPLVYFDNGATSQKPLAVIEAVENYYRHDNANIHRGIHTLSQRATDAYELVREKVRSFLNAKSIREIIFTRGTTESINLIASSFGRKFLKAGDEVLISAMEHHSNIVPWQMLREQIGIVLKVIPVDDTGTLDLAAYEALLSEKTKLVSIIHISNTLGTINPVKEMIRLAHRREIPVLVDGAQAVPHLRVDVQDLDCDFYVFSGHKLFGPTGIGILYGKERFLEAMPPYQGGGDMIRHVTFEKSSYNDLPYKFEAGTPNIAGTIGLGAALDYLQKLPWAQVQKYEKDLLHYATESLQAIPDLRILGTAAQKASVVSFVFEDIHPHDIGTILNEEGVAIRTGHHCTMPLMQRFQVPATSRASMTFYNTRSEIDALVRAIHKVKKVFS